MLKPKIYKSVPAAKVSLVCAKEFCEVVNSKALGNHLYTVICYPAMRGESSSIVDSISISKAISKLPEGTENVVVIAHNFTAEAKKILEGLKAVYFYKHSGYWSDASWHHIRDLKI